MAVKTNKGIPLVKRQKLTGLARSVLAQTNSSPETQAVAQASVQAHHAAVRHAAGVPLKLRVHVNGRREVALRMRAQHPQLHLGEGARRLLPEHDERLEGVEGAWVLIEELAEEAAAGPVARLQDYDCWRRKLFGKLFELRDSQWFYGHL